MIRTRFTNSHSFLGEGEVTIKAASKTNSYYCSRSQTDFTIRCMFPRFSHWDIAYSRQENLLKRYSMHTRGLLLLLPF